MNLDIYTPYIDASGMLVHIERKKSLRCCKVLFQPSLKISRFKWKYLVSNFTRLFRANERDKQIWLLRIDDFSVNSSM